MTAARSKVIEDTGSSAQQLRRQRILDTTIALASQGGYEAVQMRTVADEAEVALGTLYRYFPSKVHLLVSALAAQFEQFEQAGGAKNISGDTKAERVIRLLKRATRGMQANEELTEALTRAFMFADSSVMAEIDAVGMSLTRMLTGAMDPGHDRQVTDEDVTMARVIGDVWFSALMSWVTGRASAQQTASHIETAVRLILRDD